MWTFPTKFVHSNKIRLIHIKASMLGCRWASWTSVAIPPPLLCSIFGALSECTVLLFLKMGLIVPSGNVVPFIWNNDTFRLERCVFGRFFAAKEALALTECWGNRICCSGSINYTARQQYLKSEPWRGFLTGVHTFCCSGVTPKSAQVCSNTASEQEDRKKAQDGAQNVCFG